MKNVFLPVLMVLCGLLFLQSCERERFDEQSGYNSMRSAGAYFTYSLDTVCLGEPVTVTFNNNYGNNCGTTQIQMSTDGGVTWAQVASGTPSNGVLNYTFTPAAIGNYDFRGRWNATGGPSCSNTGANISFNAGRATFPVFVTNQCCETGFTGQAISCGSAREAVYEFTSEDAISYVKIQGGLTNFTGADAVVSVSGGNMNISQWTPGGSSNRVIKVEGSVGACETIRIRITWNSTNSGGVITGQWSVKDVNGVDVAAPLPGLSC